MIKIVQFLAYKLFTLAAVMLLVAFLLIGFLLALLTGLPKIIGNTFQFTERKNVRAHLIGTTRWGFPYSYLIRSVFASVRRKPDLSPQKIAIHSVHNHFFPLTPVLDGEVVDHQVQRWLIIEPNAHEWNRMNLNTLRFQNGIAVARRLYLEHSLAKCDLRS